MPTAASLPPPLTLRSTATPKSALLQQARRRQPLPQESGAAAQDNTTRVAKDVITENLRAQTEALTKLIRSKRRSHDGGGDSDPEASSDEEVLKNLGGAKGARALEVHRRLLARSPKKVVAQIMKNRNQAMSGAAPIPGVVNTFRGYFTTEVPFSKAKTAAYLIFGLAEVADLMEAGKFDVAHATLLLLLAASEQAALQGWHWPPAWLLTHLPDPPFAKIAHYPVPDTSRPLSKLAEPSLMAATMSYLKDAAVLAEAGKRKGKTANEDGDSQPSGGGKGKAKGADAQRS